MRYDPIYTDFTAEGTALAPRSDLAEPFKDPLLGIRPTDQLSRFGDGIPNVTSSQLELRRSLLSQLEGSRRQLQTIERIQTFSQQQQTAFSLLTSGRMSERWTLFASPLESVR